MTAPAIRRLALAVLLAAFGVATTPAAAGTYSVTACGPAGAGFASSQANAGGLAAWDACPGVDFHGTDTGLIARALSNGPGSRVPSRAGAWTQIDAPTGAHLESIHMLASLGRYDACFAFGVFTWNGGGFETAGQAWGFPADCSIYGSGLRYWYDPGTIALGGAAHAAIGVRCGGAKGCQTSAADPAWANARDITLTISDVTEPIIEPAYGQLYGPGWHRGTEQAWSHYRDNVGLRLLTLRVDGQLRDRQDFSDAIWPYGIRCSWTRPKPCWDITPGGMTLDTTKIADGAHMLVLEALDAAGNVAQRQHVINVDNTAPTAPVDLGLEGGEGWRRDNGFTVRWRSPEGQTSPIARARWRLCRAGAPAECTNGAGDGAEIEQLAGMRVPGAGDWALAVWLEDAAGNADVERARVARLRLDDVAPRSPGFDAPDPADPRALSLPVVDDLSGIGSVAIELRRRGDGDWRDLPTGIDGGRAITHVPDEQLADGGYDVRAIVRDQAGNAVVVTGDRDGRAKTIALPLRAPVRVTGRATAVPLPVRRCNRVRGRLRCATMQPPVASVAIGGAALAVPHGRTAAIAARLEAMAGRGVTGAPVALLERVRGTPEWRGLATLTSGADGVLAYTAPAGPARELRLAFAGDPLLLPASADVGLRVRAAGTLTVDRRTVRNGGRVRFRGRLLGGPVPSGGRRIALQAYFRGAWRTFATPGTTAAGLWTAPYRFGATFRRVTYRFRALIYAEPSYPYDAGLTPELRVTVNP